MPKDVRSGIQFDASILRSLAHYTGPLTSVLKQLALAYDTRPLQAEAASL